MAFNPRAPKYEATPVNPVKPPRHFDKHPSGAVQVARAGYEVIDQATPNSPFDPFGPQPATKKDLGKPVTTDGADRNWDSTRIGLGA